MEFDHILDGKCSRNSRDPGEIGRLPKVGTGDLGDVGTSTDFDGFRRTLMLVVVLCFGACSNQQHPF